jgi:hypothetical protein
MFCTLLRLITVPGEAIPGFDSQVSIDDGLLDAVFLLGLPNDLVLFFILEIRPNILFIKNCTLITALLSLQVIK